MNEIIDKCGNCEECLFRGVCEDSSVKIISLPNGYNGDTARFYAEPIEVDGNLVKLRCAEPGKEYMIRWARKNDVLKALGESEE